MQIEIDIVIRLADGLVGHVKSYGTNKSLITYHNGIDIEEAWWDNDDFDVVHTITMEYINEM